MAWVCCSLNILSSVWGFNQAPNNCHSTWMSALTQVNTFGCTKKSHGTVAHDPYMIHKLVTDSPHLPHVNAGRTCKSAIHGVHHHQVASAHGCKVLQASTVFERDLRAINLQIPIFCHIARPMRAIIDFFQISSVCYDF